MTNEEYIQTQLQLQALWSPFTVRERIATMLDEVGAHE